MENEPETTIGMPVYNDIEYIEETIISIITQTYTNFKLIISDDNSTDGSDLICKKYANIDNRIKYIRQSKNIGIQKNMNFLANFCKSKYFMWAADDDLWDKNFLKECIDTLKANKEVGFVYSQYYTFHKNTNENTVIDISNYSNKKPFQRLIKFINNPDDTIIYGVFRASILSDIIFPTWWRPNNKTAYNHIFPALCNILSITDCIYINYPLFYKRIKSFERTNHKIPLKGNGIKELLAFYLRRFNLIIVSINCIRNTNIYEKIVIIANLTTKWFISVCIKETRKAIKYKLIKK